MGRYYGGDIEGKVTGIEGIDEEVLFGVEPEQTLEYIGCHCCYEEGDSEYCIGCFDSKEEQLERAEECCEKGGDGSEMTQLSITIYYKFDKSHIDHIENEVEDAFVILDNECGIDFDLLDFKIVGSEFFFNYKYFFSLKMKKGFDASVILGKYCMGKLILNHLYKNDTCVFWVDLE